MALVIALFVMAVLLMAMSSSMLVGSAGMRATRNARAASQAHFIAESAISEAVQRINGPGVVHFENDVVDGWTGLWGQAWHLFPAQGGFRYSATVTATPGDEARSGRIVAVAQALDGSQNAVVATVLRSNIPGTAPGAIYLAQETATNANFNGNAFLINGNDINLDGSAGSGAAVPGISTRNDTNTQETLASLGGAQEDNVQGLGFLAGPPVVPSVNTSPAAPSVDQLNQIVDDLLARPGVVVFGDDSVNGNTTFGTTASPQITYFNGAGGLTVKGNGNAQGAGILIVEGDLTVQGTLEFAGLVIVRGKTNIGDTVSALADPDGETGILGNATIYGSVWTNDINLIVAGSAIVQYSSQALALANQVGGGGAMPSPIQVTSLANCAQLPPATLGCP